jgi:hypothetical protein
MLSILTTVIGLIAKGAASKASAGAVAGIALTAGEPIVRAFLTGFNTGAVPQIESLGMLVAQAVVGGIVGYATVWLAPKNTAVLKL